MSRLRILSLDPSLSVVGWCVADVDGREIEVARVGRVASSREGTPVERTRLLCEEVRRVAYDYAVMPTGYSKLVTALIEVPSGRTAMRHRGGGHGLAVYGFAVGAIYEMFYSLLGHVETVDEGVWTGSRSKQVRKKIAVEHYEPLKRIKDPGMDISDEIGRASCRERVFLLV